MAECFGADPGSKGQLEYRPELENADSKDSAVAAKTIGEEDVFKAKDPVKPPKPIYSPDPEYTERARKARVEGFVVLAVIIGKTGSLKKSISFDPSGTGSTNAFDAIRSWKFEPAMKDGVPGACVVNVEVTFRLY